ncbi:coenzyme PQQ synthesis protein D (PqqD) [Streptomyces sp. SLBN-118]|uniref:PqqD family protein n=1 Tax=Streptomyces sp. SLBN-118 TaxID=2768454 RepID=UPI0011507EE5|nr:PqqD family protein [Streptomyces sp. SLBN-118]TQK45288.1 coenzyme PQQ synthesis protein D (PqqD) [Streptomyces sp. SLBN-118]
MLDLRPTPTVRVTITERGGMLLDLRGRGRWYALTFSGALWWRYLAEGATVDEAADHVAALFGADADRVRADMRDLAQQLRDRHMLYVPARRRWHR